MRFVPALRLSPCLPTFVHTKGGHGGTDSASCIDKPLSLRIANLLIAGLAVAVMYKQEDEHRRRKMTIRTLAV